MEQAPTDVVRVIQKTVERTVEKVAPPEIQTKIITKEKTVMVSDADLIVNAVEVNAPSIVRIYSQDDEPELLALGVVISSSGIIATDASFIAPDTEYTVEAMGGSYNASVLRIDESKQIVLLEIKDSETVPKPASIYKSSIKTGASVVLLSGDEKLFVDKGIVSELDGKMFGTNINSSEILPGSVLTNIDGNLVGISTSASRAVGSSWFITAREILTILNTPDSSEEDEEEAVNIEGFENGTTTTTATSQQAASAAALEDTTNN